MTRTSKPVATSYDEILRRTVVDPDSSVRPTQQQVKAAYEGARVLDGAEQQLHDRVAAAVAGIRDVDASQIQIEIDRERVTLRGRVLDASAFEPIERVVHDVQGVGEVVNYLVIEPGGEAKA